MRAWVLARLSVALSLVADEQRRRALSEEAVLVARAVGDQRALGYALAARCDANSGPDGSEDRVTAAAEIVGSGRGDRRPPARTARVAVAGRGAAGDR